MLLFHYLDKVCFSSFKCFENIDNNLLLFFFLFILPAFVLAFFYYKELFCLKNKLNVLEKNSMSAFFMLDMKHKIIKASPGFMTMIDVNNDLKSLKLKTLYDKMNEDDVSAFSSLFLKGIPNGEKMYLEFRIKGRERTRFFAAYLTKKSSRYLNGTLHDVTEIKAYEKNIAKYQKKMITLQRDIKSEYIEKIESLTAEVALLKSNMKEMSAMQTRLVFSEKMETLGNLVAGMAHEINTPIASIVSVEKTMRDSLCYIKNNLLNVLDLIKESSMQNFINCINEVSGNTEKKRSIFLPKEKRRLIKEFEINISKFCPENASYIANMTVNAGLHENSDFIDILKLQNSRIVVELIFSIANIFNSLDVISEASKRSSKMIFALKKHARFDSERKKIPFSIAESVENVLLLYENKIKQGVNLFKDYDAVPDIDGIPDEISQVWSNIIFNSLQAMNYKGELSIFIKKLKEYVMVNISDNGPGIPANIQDKIFEPFFTTKQRGEGSGLGLDICRTIIKNHNGRIELESSENKGTCFKVFLPIQPDSSMEVNL